MGDNAYAQTSTFEEGALWRKRGFTLCMTRDSFLAAGLLGRSAGYETERMDENEMREVGKGGL